MNATDVMIGDWVYNSLHEPVRVNAAPYNYTKENVNLAFYGIKDCTPIPLTSKILEKIATKTPGYLVWVLEGCDGAEVQYVPSTLDRINPIMEYRLAPIQRCFGVQDTLICHLKYVHELQHALKLCGINKKIKL